MRVTVQIYGMSFCGSTLLDLMIGHGENCLSCGEVYATYKRRGDKYENPPTEFWKKLRREGEENLYTRLHDMGYMVICDSSKLYPWLSTRAKEAEREGIHVVKVVLFKTPEGWTGSMLKRGNTVNMSKWVTRYKQLLTRLPDATYIEYKTLATTPRRTLRQLCLEHEIPYFEGKEKYWLQDYSHLYGNASTRKRTEITYTEDKTHTMYNTRESNKIYQSLKSKEKTLPQ